MGKSLSILAIATQVYNINGWSIWPPHLALGDDVELPPAMEHLRPYLRKRKGPIRAPPGLRHNQRYYPKLAQSRQLLMDSQSSEGPPSQMNVDIPISPLQKQPSVNFMKVDTPHTEHSMDSQQMHTESFNHENYGSAQSRSDSQESFPNIPSVTSVITSSELSPDSDPHFGSSITNDAVEVSQMDDNEQRILDMQNAAIDATMTFINEQVHKNKFGFDCSNSKRSFVRVVKLVISKPQKSDMQNLRRLYQMNKFDPCMVMFINGLVSGMRGTDLQNESMMQRLYKVISVPRPTPLNQMTRRYKLVVTLESLSKDIIFAKPEFLWEFGIWYDLLYPQAVSDNLVPKVDDVFNPMVQPGVRDDLSLAIIPFFDDNIEYKNKFETDPKFATYMELMKIMVENEGKYPYLKEAYDVRVQYIFTILHGVKNIQQFDPQYATLIQDSFSGFYHLNQETGIYVEQIKQAGPLLAKFGLAKRFLPRNKDIVDGYIFNKDNFNEITRKRKCKTDLDKHLYSLSYVSQEIMYGSMQGIHGNVILWAYQHLFDTETRKNLNQKDEAANGQLFSRFGWIYDKRSLSHSVEFKGSDFDQYIGYLMDIENWKDKEYELQAEFKVPYLNTLKFKTEYLGKVFKNAGYDLKGYRVQSSKEANVIITVQNLLNDWYDEYQHQQDIHTPKPNWSPSAEVNKLIIKEKFSKELLEKDYTDMIKNTERGKRWARFKRKVGSAQGTALSQGALKYFFED